MVPRFEQTWNPSPLHEDDKVAHRLQKDENEVSALREEYRAEQYESN